MRPGDLEALTIEVSRAGSLIGRGEELPGRKYRRCCDLFGYLAAARPS